MLDTTEIRGLEPVATPGNGRLHVVNGWKPAGPRSRPVVAGKFVEAGGEKLYVRGVTYGTFAGEEDEYPDEATIDSDFAAMAANGVNTVRTYTPPPIRLLDAAARHGLFAMAGLAWEQHVTFLDDRRRVRSIEDRILREVRARAGHPALLCHVVGNEIPAPVVRWHGRRAIERFLRRLTNRVHDADPGGLVTYANYPSTEYLDLSFLDLVCFNVYLEERESYEDYVARLQNLAGDRPLLLTEIGLDSRRNGASTQAETIEFQLRSAFAAGAAGTCVFAWSDEWHRGGHAIEEWDFGLTDRERRPKPALEAVRCAYADAPFGNGVTWPRVSAVVCTHNGSATLGRTLDGLAELDYPDFEILVVDDGSTDESATIAEARPGIRVIRTAKRGLGHARNVGLTESRGEIVAYLDDDAWPDRHWLRYLAQSFLEGEYAGIGGPNIPPRDQGVLADCVADAPGGPNHILLTDRVAEHVPGCNMAFRRAALEEIGGFDPQFHVAGDDVDVCWRVQEAGGTIGFSPGAMVWHRRRSSVRAYLRQQRGYGRAEALLERKWPEKYNGSGHVRWGGRIYGSVAAARSRWRVYYGTWGTAPFQPRQEQGAPMLAALPLMPEWYLVIVSLAMLSIYELTAGIVTVSVPGIGLPLSVIALLLAVAALVVPSIGAGRASGARRGRHERFRRSALTAYLTLVQPLARLGGRLRYGLTPWRRHTGHGLRFPGPRVGAIWCEVWSAPAERLATLESALREDRVVVVQGGPYERWDAEARTGALAAARLVVAVEEHGEGRQLVRYRIWPKPSRLAIVAGVAVGALIALCAIHSTIGPLAFLAAIGAALTLRTLRDAASAAWVVEAALVRQGVPLGRRRRSMQPKQPAQPTEPATIVIGEEAVQMAEGPATDSGSAL